MNPIQPNPPHLESLTLYLSHMLDASNQFDPLFQTRIPIFLLGVIRRLLPVNIIWKNIILIFVAEIMKIITSTSQMTFTFSHFSKE